MDKQIIMEVVAVVGILTGVALYMGQTELASAGVGGLVGFLSAERVGNV